MTTDSDLRAPESFAPGRVSVIIPTHNSSRTMRACVDSVTEQTYQDVELIVVDNHSTDDTADIARAAADRVILTGPERSAQRNRGFEAATGEFVLFLDSDQVLSPQVVSDAVSEFATNGAVGALVIPEISFGEGFFAGVRAHERRLNQGDPLVEAARIFRREAVIRVGGFDETLTAMEDWDLADRVTADGWGSSRTTASVHHDEGRVVLREVVAKKLYYAKWLRQYVEDQSTPTRSFSRVHWLTQPKLLFMHPVRTGGLVILKSVEALAFWRGFRRSRTEQ